MSNGKGSANTRVRDWDAYRKTIERIRRRVKRQSRKK